MKKKIKIAHRLTICSVNKHVLGSDLFNARSALGCRDEQN